MAFAREIFTQIKRNVSFQQSEKEKNSHYTVLGNTIVRVSNQCTYLNIWDNFLKKNPKMKGMKIISIVFEDWDTTFSDECLYLQRDRRKPIIVEEIVYPIRGNGNMIQRQEIKTIIKDLQTVEHTGQYTDNIGKGQRFVRMSINVSNIKLKTAKIPEKPTIKVVKKIYFLCVRAICNCSKSLSQVGATLLSISKL